MASLDSSRISSENEARSVATSENLNDRKKMVLTGSTPVKPTEAGGGGDCFFIVSTMR